MEISSTKDDHHEPPSVAAVCSGSSQDSEYVSEDEHIHHLEKSGALQQVVGSQSILSQELHNLGESHDVGAFSQNVPGFSQESVMTTESAEFNSQILAQKYGLLSQDFMAGSRSGEETESNKDVSDSQGSRSESNFGTLLDAVQIFQSQEEQEELKLKMFESVAMETDPAPMEGVTTRSRLENRLPTTDPKPKPDTKKVKKNALPVSKNGLFYVVEKKSGGKRKRKDNSEQVKQQKLAQRAADLAQRTINDPDLAKRLLLSMALTRENPRSAPETLPGPGATLPEGFFWAHYPPLETVLKDNMAEYYELSVTKCQSAQQQSFNNTLVELVRAESDRQGWLFAPCFTDKTLRDRIRCYYKTHIQNAKKRLRTMVKNPTKRANARHLCAHLDLIEINVKKNATLPAPARLAPTTPQEWGLSMAGYVPNSGSSTENSDPQKPRTGQTAPESKTEASAPVSTPSVGQEVPLAPRPLAGQAAPMKKTPAGQAPPVKRPPVGRHHHVWVPPVGHPPYPYPPHPSYPPHPAYAPVMHGAPAHRPPAGQNAAAVPKPVGRGAPPARPVASAPVTLAPASKPTAV